MSLSELQVTDFQKTIWDFYLNSGRHTLPWREPEPDRSYAPYKILVSEVMLQQTQVGRVIPKYGQFLELFPTVEALADSSLAAVLTEWGGLGYNRRAKFLHDAAKTIGNDLSGKFPEDTKSLISLPGVGVNTAGAIQAYAFNKPAIFVETNIRTVYFNHFMQGRGDISDREVRTLLEATLDTENPREWYWALMDYGAYLKTTGMKLNKLSKHYNKQAKFEGSQRQIRGEVIRLLAVDDLSLADMHSYISDDRLSAVLDDLSNEGLIVKKAKRYYLSD